MTVLRALSIAATLVLTGPAAVTQVGTLPGGSTSTVFGMAGDLAVGTSSSSEAFQRAFVRDAGGMHDLGGMGELTNSSAADVNGAGHVVGLVTSDNGSEARAVRWVDGTVEDLGGLGGPSAGALGINDHDVVVGWAATADGVNHGFRWTAGKLEDLDAVLPKPSGSTVESAAAIDENGHIVGDLALADQQRVGFLWDGNSMQLIQLSPGQSTQVSDLAADGTVAATSWEGNGARPFVWRNGVSTPLAYPAGDLCASTTAIAGNGDVVGWSSLCGRSPTRAVIWRDGLPTDAQTLVAPSEQLIVRGFWAADERGRAGGYAERVGGTGSAVVVDPVVDRARIAGADAVGTSIEAFRRLAPGPRFGVVIAPVDAPADLALASFLAARKGWPLLLTGRSALDGRVAAALRDAPMFGSTVLLVGGTTVLSRSVEDGISALRLHSERVAGADRYGTSAAVNNAAGGSAAVFAVAGEDTSTAISAVPLAALQRASVVLTGPGHPAPAGARQLTWSDRARLADELAAHPMAPAIARFGRISDGAVAAVVAARAGSPMRWVDAAENSGVFVVGGTAVL